MKKFLRIIACVLVFACLLSASAFAEQGKGLNAFEKIANMDAQTYSDLVSNHWAYSGIKVCYDRGILIGYPDGTFRPEDNVTWSHAVTIAARVHSTYNGKSFDSSEKPGQYWYTPYYNYCKSNDLLPDSCPALSKLDDKEINRYDLAYIFSGLLKDKDMPKISDRTMSDSASIPEEYSSYVRKMYSAGIMNGMENNEFRGNDYATRAQIAAVVARLLIPAERVGHDAKANAAMAPFEANLENDSVAVQIGSDYYCIYKYRASVNEEVYALYLTRGDGSHTELYTCNAGEYLNNISLYNGKVYFAKSTVGTADGTLLCYNPTTGKISTVYSGNIVESYCFYNGKLYALLFTDYAEKTDGYRYSFGKISDGFFSPIHTGYTYAEARYFTPYGWNGKIYFKLGTAGGATNLYAYNISNGNISLVCNKNINTSLFDGHVMYFLAFKDDGSYDHNLYAISLQCPDAVYTQGEFPAAANAKFRSLYKSGDKLYCLSSMNGTLFSMDKSGATRLAITCGGVYSSVCFTNDKLVVIPNTLATSNPNEIKMYNAKTLSSRVLYGDFIGVSCYYVGARFMPESGQPTFESTESVSSVSNLKITVPEAFFKGDDLIIKAKYENNTGSDIKLYSYIISVAVNGQTVAQDINRMSGYSMKNHDIQTFTFVLSNDDVMRKVDLSKDEVSIQIVPTYDIVPEETTKN